MTTNFGDLHPKKILFEVPNEANQGMLFWWKERKFDYFRSGLRNNKNPNNLKPALNHNAPPKPM